MKQLITILFLVSFSTATYAEMGAFMVLKSAYLYPSLKSKSKVLTRIKAAYPVTGFKVVGKNKLLYQILVPETEISTGSGFIAETDSELAEKKDILIKVYPVLPTQKISLVDYRLVPIKALLITGRQEVTPDFPQLSFRAVNFKGLPPKSYWVDNWAGVYRLDKDENFLNFSWAALEQTNVPTSKKIRIIMGLVEPGFSKEEVKLALGAPQKVEPLADGELQWVYPQKKVVFEKGKVIRTL